MTTPKLSTEEKAAIAIEWFSTFGRPKEERISHLEAYKNALAKLGKSIKTEKDTVSERTIRRAIETAFTEGIVEVRHTQLAKSNQINRNEDLETRLTEGFNRLRKAIVIEPHQGTPNDEIHELLGRGMAEEISRQTLLIQHGHRIGVGSGRGPHYAIENLLSLPQVRVQEIWLMSLTGSLSPQKTDRHIELVLDADTHVEQLSKYFDTSGVTIHSRRIRQNIAHPAQIKDQLLKETWLDENRYLKNIPDHTIVGVGVLAGEHRFYKEIKTALNEASTDKRALDETKEDSLLYPIYENLENLIANMERIGIHKTHCPVADICNRLFYVPPPPWLKAKERNRYKEYEDCIKETIDEINNCMITITKTQLEKARNVMLVAGTPIKASAIYHLLKGNTPARIDVLSTDKETAEILVKYANAS